MASKLFQPCDRESVKSDKYVKHGTPIIKLVPIKIGRVLRKLSQEEA